jgi:hypothetical protein
MTEKAKIKADAKAAGSVLFGWADFCGLSQMRNHKMKDDESLLLKDKIGYDQF